MNEQLPMKYADMAMFDAEKHQTYDPEHGVMPKVTLLSMTTDPLGAVAAFAEMYKGNVVRDIRNLPQHVKQKAWEDATATHLAAPLEAIDLHFMIEGVDRAFTHQMVRQRTAV